MFFPYGKTGASYPYEITGKVIVLYILIFRFFK
jgi:hypothetical protein